MRRRRKVGRVLHQVVDFRQHRGSGGERGPAGSPTIIEERSQSANEVGGGRFRIDRPAELVEVAEKPQARLDLSVVIQGDIEGVVLDGGRRLMRHTMDAGRDRVGSGGKSARAPRRTVNARICLEAALVRFFEVSEGRVRTRTDRVR